MQIPKNIPLLKQATVIVSIYSAVWISLEGKLLQVIILGIAVTLLLIGFLFQRTLSGRRVSTGRWLLIISFVGLLTGAGSSLLTLVFMAIKTGLHAHGPEFTFDEINWVFEQIPYWIISGFSGGLGIGLLFEAIIDN